MLSFWRDEDEGLDPWWKDPWEVNPEWAGGRVTARDHTPWFELVSVVFLNAIFWTLAVLMYRDGPGGEVPDPIRYGVLVLPIIALVATGWVLLRRRALAARDAAVLQVEGGTGFIGGRLRGTLATGLPASQLAGPTLRLRLACYHVYPGANPRRRDNVPRPKLLWEEETEVPWTEAAGDVHVPVSFCIPPSLPGSAERFEGRTEYVAWELEARAPDTRPPYHMRMRVPVFERRDGGG